MNTAELKLNLIDKLAFVNDENLLNQIHILLKDVEIDVKPYELNEEQIQMLKESESDYNAGRVHSNDSVFKEDKEWLENL